MEKLGIPPKAIYLFETFFSILTFMVTTTKLKEGNLKEYQPEQWWGCMCVWYVLTIVFFNLDLPLSFVVLTTSFISLLYAF